MSEPETPAKRTLWQKILRAAKRFGCLYLGMLIVLLFLENRFLFRPVTAAQGWGEPPEGLTVEDVTFPATDGTSIHGWWTEPPSWSPSQGAILYSHGNAGNLSGRGLSVKVYRDLGYAVLIYDYPGYGKSAGRPSEKGIYAAGEGGYNWLTQTKKIPPESAILYGGSLGGAVAVDLGARMPNRAIVLVGAFTSFPDMAQRTFPLFPARWLVSNQMNNLARIRDAKGAVFIAHGTADTLVPYEMAQRLHAAAPEPKFLLTIQDGGHNDGVGAEFFRQLRGFLNERAPLPAN